MSAHYTLADDQVAQDEAVRARQETIMGKTGEIFMVGLCRLELQTSTVSRWEMPFYGNRR
jgi:hypothetical protein